MNLHYISRGFLGGSRGAGAGMDILPSIPAAPRPCTSSPRSHISELCHLRIPQRHIRAVPSRGAWPCHQPAGAAAAPPLCHGTSGAAGLPDFPCPPSTALSQEVDAELEPGCAPDEGHTGWGWAEREWLGIVWGTGHGGNEAPLCWHLLSCRGTSSASPCWLILLGFWWGSGGAGIPSAVLLAPQIFFIRVMFLVLIPFTFSQLSRPVAYHRHW